MPDVGKRRLSRVSYVMVGRSDAIRPELKRLASGSDWKTLVNPGAVPRNVLCPDVST